MPDSMAEYLQAEMECEDLLTCLYGLKRLDREVFRVLVESETAMTVDDVAEEVDRERSTAYRAVQRLLQAGVIRKEQVNYDHGGYYHVYRPTDADEVADDMQRTLNDWYAKTGQLIHEFRETYGDEPREAETPPAE